MTGDQARPAGPPPPRSASATATQAPTPPLRRPASLDPQELGFTPRDPVPWLSPGLLLSTGLRTLLAALFGAYLDKRELQNSLPGETIDQAGSDGELWLDYVADLGDGFNSTYSVAYLLAQPRLDVDGHPLPRARVLVMGGDQAYPTASAEAYKDRCKGPYQAALPCPPAGVPRPILYALPGNHDWYDGLTAFLRLFVRIKTDEIGGWRTRQSRSYFALKLPHNWWLFAVDEQSGAYLDDPQLLYFERAAKQLGPDDRVILVVPEPAWVKAVDEPRAYDTTDYFVRTILAPTGAQIPLIIAGDLHHYARYVGPERQLVTCGGGGAYLSATHKLPKEITVPPEDTLVRKASPRRKYKLAERFPDPGTSRRYAWGVFHRLPLRNVSFVALLGTIHVLLMLAMAGPLASRLSRAAEMTGTEQRLFSIPLIIMLLVMMGAAFFFAKPPSAGGKRYVRHSVLAVAHGLAHIGLAFAGAWAWVHLPFIDWEWPLPLAPALVLYGPVAGIAASLLVAAYLLVAGTFGVNLNELFAGQGIDDAKIFLRLHIDSTGKLTIYPIAIDKVCRKWEANPGGQPDSPWLEPKQPLRVRLAEQPIEFCAFPD